MLQDRRNKLRELLINTDPHHRTKRLKRENLIQELIDCTDFLPEDSTILCRIWHVINEDYNLHYCKICGKPVKFYNAQHPYALTCSNNCKKLYFESEEYKEIHEKAHEKAKQTWIKKYGYDHPMKSEEIRKKIDETCLKNNGCLPKDFLSVGFSENQINPMKDEKVKKRIIEKNLKKYGVEHFFQSKEFLQKTINHTKTTKYQQKVVDSMNENIQKYELNKSIHCIGYVEKRICKYKCDKCGNEFNLGSSDFHFRLKNNHYICTYCNPLDKTYSIQEKELFDFIKEIYDGEIIENNRTIIPPYELDIYLPEKQIAIEYNGLYWHSEANKDKNYHKMKSDLCKEKGIHLIHVFEDDWKYKNEILKSVIKNFLGCGYQRILYARKLQIRDVPHKDINPFLEENHMLGKIGGSESHCIGLYQDDELLSCMVFQLVSKETKVITLSRYAIKQNVNIKGGAERIFSNFLKLYGNLYNKVITFNDNGTFKGTVHYRLGFVHTGENPPNYMYYDRKLGIRVSKQSLRKIRLSYKKDEQQFIEENRYYKVYNAGNDTCEYVIKNNDNKTN